MSARRAAAALIAAPWVAWAVVRGLGLDLGHPVVPAISFTPYVALTSPVPVLVALVLRRRAAAAVSAVAAVVLVGAVAPRALGGPDERPGVDGPGLVVMTSNLYVGRAEARDVVRLVREHDVDVLSLQELTPEMVADLDRAGVRRLLPHRVIRARTGAGGSGLMARVRLRPTGPTDPWGAAQPAAWLELEGARGVVVKAVHPFPPTSVRKVGDWERELRDLPSAGRGVLRILAGDFNATLDHRALRGVIDRGYVDAADAVGEGLTPTWPDRGRVLRLTIDHVLADRRIAVQGVSVHRVRGTDHRAVVARLRLPSR